VFFDANSDVPYTQAIHAIDLIEQSVGRVVLLTPETKKLHIPGAQTFGLTADE
jgi:hypothetical protein